MKGPADLSFISLGGAHPLTFVMLGRSWSVSDGEDPSIHARTSQPMRRHRHRPDSTITAVQAWMAGSKSPTMTTTLIVAASLHRLSFVVTAFPLVIRQRSEP